MTMNAVLEDGMREQLAALHRRIDAGMPRAGWKICVNDARMQKRLGIDRSFVGFLDGARSLSSGETWRVGDGSIIGVEPEIAIRFAAAVPERPRAQELLRAIAGVAPAIEIVDWKDAKFDLRSVAASSSFHAGFVTGELRPLADVPAIGEGCPIFRRGSEILGVPDAALVPADLVGLVAGVATFLAGFGESIAAGDWLICGACTNPGRVEAGDVVEADFAGLGRVHVEFAAD